MAQDSDIATILYVGRQIITAAGCASLITIDEVGLPSSRPVRTFPSDDALTKITIPTDSNSRKTQQAERNPRVLLGYLDLPSRGYVTVIGNAELNDRPEDKQAIWVDQFSAFWPDGPEAESFLLIDVIPERIEMRSYTQDVAQDPTRWTPVTLQRRGTDEWIQTG